MARVKKTPVRRELEHWTRAQLDRRCRMKTNMDAQSITSIDILQSRIPLNKRSDPQDLPVMGSGTSGVEKE
jgi:hypothetical protein